MKDDIEKAMDKLAEGGSVWAGVEYRNLRAGFSDHFDKVLEDISRKALENRDLMACIRAGVPTETLCEGNQFIIRTKEPCKVIWEDGQPTVIRKSKP